jgi:hypothetical protein
MKNVFPSCGAGLLSSKDSSIISTIQARVSSQRFSSGFTESQIYDISLFIFNELKDGFGKLALELAPRSKKRTINLDDEDLESDDILHSEDEGTEVDDIRNEVLAELGGDFMDEDEEGEDEDEDLMSKADRLKKLHQQRVSTNPDLVRGTPSGFKRSGFKGVTRST